ncbi:MAG: nucleotidyltransferase family protein [Candidatus Omnitrophica bacterium]|nr:nucleotidyltransferase family protein [Candidatus Omnitrophota bacterium]
MKALILAAGYATRLYPLTRRYPKSLLKIKGRPIIDYILEKIEEIEAIDEVFVVTNNKFFPFFEKWKQTQRSKNLVTLVNDLTWDNASRLGAIGDIEFVINAKKIEQDLLVIGGDNLFDGALKDFVSLAHRYLPNVSIGVYDIGDIKEAGRYGVLKLGADNRIIDFQEKPKIPTSTLVAMCVYYFPKEKLELIKEYRESYGGKSDAMGFYIDWLRIKEAVYGIIFGKKWYDIGDFRFYEQAKASF